MKYFLSLFLITAILFSSAGLVSNAAETAKDITDSVEFYINDESAVSDDMLDDDYYSVCSFKKGDIFTIKSKQEIFSLYILFDREVEAYTLESGTVTQNCGEYGFFHEAIKLKQPSKEVKITMPKTGICRIYVFSEGIFPDFVQQWEPPCEDCDILLFPTHADDEMLFFGSIIPTYCAELGYKVQVAYLTRHYVKKERDHELLNGLWVVGAQNYPLYSNIPDYYSKDLETAEEQYEIDDIIKYQVSVIRRFKPEVIIGHDFKGEYGHGMHMLNAKALAQAVLLCGDSGSFSQSAQKYGVHTVEKLYVHLYEKNKIVLDVDAPLSAFNGQTAYEIAKLGFEEHKSQLKNGGFDSYQIYSMKKFGLYYSTVGADTGNDIMEHTTYAREFTLNTTNGTVAEHSNSADSNKALDNKNKVVVVSGNKIKILPFVIVIIITVVVIITATIIALKIRKRKQ